MRKIKFENMLCRFVMCMLCIVSIVNSLECGLSSNRNQEDIKKYTNICMMKANKNDLSTENTSTNQSYDTSYEDASDSLEDALDNKKSVNKQTNMSQEKMMNTVKEDVMMNGTDNNENLNNTEISDNCVIQCVFKQLGMIDINGYPDHAKISESLIRGAENRELKDFLQDSTDDCFQLMKQDEHMDTCDFSTQLIKCLAEKGKSNCSDWPMSDSPFPHIF